MLLKAITDSFLRNIINRQLVQLSNVRSFTASAKVFKQPEKKTSKQKHNKAKSTLDTGKHAPRDQMLYLQQHNLTYLLDILPHNALRRNQHRRKCFIINDKIAKSFVNLIKDEIIGNGIILESHPGVGFVTEQLLEIGVPFLHLCETNKAFHQHLQGLSRKYPKKLAMHNIDILYMRECNVFDNLRKSEQLSEAFMNLEQRSWEDEPGIQIIGCIASMKPIWYIIMCLVFQKNLMAFGRPKFCISVPLEVWMILSASSKSKTYKASSVLFQSLFSYKLLGTLPGEAFIPWSSNSAKSKSKSYTNEMYVLKMEPRNDLFKKDVSKTLLIHYWYFVRHCMVSKKLRIIPELEKWVPNCGPRLIARNYNIYSQFKELEPNEFLNFHKMFSSWPEYNNSPFVDSFESFIKNAEMEQYTEPIKIRSGTIR